MAAAADIKHDLTLRKIPLSKLIYRTAWQLDVEPVVIRRKLAAQLGVANARCSQIENVLRTEETAIGRHHIVAINSFFSKLLKEEVRVEAEYEEIAVGIFATA